MKTMHRLALMVIAIALLVAGGPVFASATATDEGIESAARNSYVFKTYLKDDAIQVVSRDGVVILTGTVAEEPHKSLAQETVANLPGVKSVENRLEIKGEPVAENLDAWISMKVKTSLLFHRNLSTSKTDVQVKDGVVTLRGEAASPAQIDLTTQYVKDVEGVKGVQNEMTASPTPGTPDEKTMGEKMSDVIESIDDASITALVKMTLMYHRSTSALHTNVETNNGMVTLEGKAKNAAEKDLVTKYVQDVYGVKGVANNISIEESKAD
ncbi:MAG: BON domain-containing protein [Proteobacteria bacterium]|nr:BON domain-containing protein [Pseudomonadota bacterium]MBU4295583.1 BON domain-containing protein [Pseudomonadota bacterium]MCG2747372.1 BON domain-containing protein [Desulfobulbaceae bacterium]